MPSTTTDQELLHTRNSLPEDVVVQRVDESEPFRSSPNVRSLYLFSCTMSHLTRHDTTHRQDFRH
jgi:hypothetical protein